MTLADVAYSAARAARVLKAAGRGLSTSEKSDVLTISNEISDEWQARKAYAWNVNFTALTLRTNHQPHTIGPSGADFTAQRPVKIENAALILTGAQPIDLPLRIRDDDWWAANRVKSLATSIPTDLYYSPDFPNGSIYLWPIPTVAYGLRLEMWVSLQKFTALTDPFSAPPAFETAFKLTMAETMCTWWGLPIPPLLQMQRLRAIKAIQTTTMKSPRTGTTNGRSGGYFNYMTGDRA